MEKYIPLDAVLAEIDKRIKAIEKIKLNDIAGRDELIYIKGFINSLEVKEVDLETEIDNFWNKNYKKLECGVKDIKLIGEHFFELGLKAQKGE